ncbi:winged helix-turn-helix domain-containing protein [Kitasatospora hibisci]|uniref:winged helix-turn-helix domain-containing protein n=1 Tax=Kitasatospora hibisci TaxID=3369522 RepID=UPI003753F611
MTSSPTAAPSLPGATPHLRAVRSVPQVADRPAAERSSAERSSAERPHGGPAQPPLPAPSTRLAVQVPPPQALLAALPKGAAVVAALPSGVLPQALLAQCGAQSGAQSGAAAPGHPMVGYLVLVPAGSGTPAGSAAPAPGSFGPVAARPVRPAGRGITVDVERRNAYVDGRLLDLTYLEFELLAHLTEHPQRVHTRDHLVSAVWGYGHVGDGRTVDVHVARLRRKLGTGHRDSIVTVRRVGYKYTPVA